MRQPETSWIEGPYVRLHRADELHLHYVHRQGEEVFALEVDPHQEPLIFEGLYHDGDQEYWLARTPGPAAAEQEGIEKILLLGDQHGQYTKLLKFLKAQQVIDAQANWQWGRGHLVMCGDLLDRGLQVLPLLWLLNRLELQARRAGGAVHVLLGNHELMVLQGDYRYVNPLLLRLYGAAGLRYGEGFGPDWHFGQWLRSRHAVIRLNGLLISHAGISPAIADVGFSISDINERIRAGIDEARPRKEDKALLAAEGPLWYRGYVMDTYSYTPALVQQTKKVLEQYQASKMVVAHTPVRSIQQRQEGLVWAIDLDIESPQVMVAGLLVEGERFSILGSDGSRQPLMP